VNGVTYTWDDNGNLLNDGVNTYAYDSANRLTAISGQQSAAFVYSGLDDRLQQTVNGVTTNYTLDLNTGLTQVLDDGENAYLYGVDRIAQVNTGTEYFLGDALESVRQLTNSQGSITLTKSYAPYGEVMASAGSGASVFAYTGEQQDVSGLVYLRARYYDPINSRFLNRDTWGGEANLPMSFNRWNYTNANPVNYTDPSGHFPPLWCQFMPNKITYEVCVDLYYGIEPLNIFEMGEYVSGSKGCYRGPTQYRAPGYVEGTGLTIPFPSVMNWLFAAESVYNFATMEHSYFVNGNFNQLGIPGVGLSDLVVGIAFTEYAGDVYGFRSPDLKGNSKFLQDYPGPVVIGFIGVGYGPADVVEVGPAVGIGYTSFVSAYDTRIRGFGKYIMAGFGLDPVLIVDAGFGVLSMMRVGKVDSYLDNNNKVKKAKLYLDILTGKHGVWLTDFNPRLYPLGMISRIEDANNALSYAITYEELHAENK
jgi:RHS repeat-associated protein